MRSLPWALLMLISSVPSLAAEVPRVTAPVRVDGVIDASEWSAIPARSLAYEIEPLRVAETTWQTTARIAHDGRRLLIAITASDAEAGQIVAPRGARDSLGNEDQVLVQIDAEGNRQRHFEFRVNAAGVLADSIVGGSGSGSPQWSGAWEAAAQRTAQGYVVEIAIPLTTINARVAEQDGAINLALNVARRIGRDRRELLSLQPVDLRELCAECQYEQVSLAGAQVQSQSLQLRPYLAVRRAGVHPANGAATHDTDADPGIDLLWQLGDGRKLVGTINPDFSEVAPDQIQFDVNRRYAVVFGENRPFFTENAGLFGAPLALVYTRSIADPLAAAAWSSTGERSSLAALYARDRATSFLLPSSSGSRIVALEGESHTFLARAMRNGAVGRRLATLVTGRLGDDYSDVVVSVDGRQVFGEHGALDAALAVSDARAGEQVALANALDRHSKGYMARLNHQYKSGNLTVTTATNRATPDFRADAGNIARVGITNAYHEWAWSIPRPAGSFVSRYGIGGWVNTVNELHSPDGESNAELWGYYSLRDGSGGDANVRYLRETYLGRDYHLLIASAGAEWQITARARVWGGLGYEDVIDVAATEKARSLRPYLGFNVKVGSTFSVQGDLNYNDTRGSSLRRFNTRSAVLRANWSPLLGHTVSLVGNWGASRDNPLAPGAPTFRSDRLRGQVVYLYQRSDRSSFHIGVNFGGAGVQGLDSVRRTDELLFGKVVLNLDWMR